MRTGQLATLIAADGDLGFGADAVGHAYFCGGDMQARKCSAAAHTTPRCSQRSNSAAGSAGANRNP
jgi:hypothetical protein